MINEKHIEVYKLSTLLSLKTKEFDILYQQLQAKVVDNDITVDMQQLLEDLIQNNLEIKQLSKQLSKLIG